MLALLLILISCGKNDDSKSTRTQAIEEQETVGFYRAIMRPLNNHLSGFIPTGFVEINVTDNTFNAKAMLDDDAKVVHIQSIHEGTRCPEEQDDRNQDGVIDIQEAQLASGQVFISLDSDLNSEVSGEGKYPLGGGYTYLETADLDQLETDTKQRTKQNLNLSGRVVLIHGVSSATKLPLTIARREGFTPQASVPIVCGILRRKNVEEN
jgi:hypothetical protein